MDFKVFLSGFLTKWDTILMSASVMLILNEPDSKSMKRYDNLKNWPIFSNKYPD